MITKQQTGVTPWKGLSTLKSQVTDFMDNVVELYSVDIHFLLLLVGVGTQTATSQSQPNMP